MKRRRAKKVKAGSVTIGGDAPVSVQSMTTADTEDAEATLAQVRALAGRGADIVRVAVPTKAAAEALAEITKNAPVPIVADINFRGDLALRAIDAGAAKIRLNPGNIRNWETLRKITTAAKDAGVAIRIGANSGSIRKKDTNPKITTPELMARTTIRWCDRFEADGFSNIVLSLKGSSARETIEANRIVAEQCRYPLHLGVTSAGLGQDAVIKSAVAIGALLEAGIGDTIRVSITGDPLQEVDAGISILRSLGLGKPGVQVISCPTCARAKIDVEKLASLVRSKTADMEKNLTVAIMGCEVNGPGEAAGADCGIAGGHGFGTLFEKGTSLRKVPEAELVDALLELVEML